MLVSVFKRTRISYGRHSINSMRPNQENDGFKETKDMLYALVIFLYPPSLISEKDGELLLLANSNNEF